MRGNASLPSSKLPPTCLAATVALVDASPSRLASVDASQTIGPSNGLGRLEAIWVLAVAMIRRHQTHISGAIDPMVRITWVDTDVVGGTRIRLAAVAVVSALLVGLSTALSPVARAEGQVGTQPYQDSTWLQGLVDGSATGKDVNVAVIGGAPNFRMPELDGLARSSQGSWSPICADFDLSQDGTDARSTNVASILFSQSWGWAPDARSQFYLRSPSEGTSTCGVG